MTPMGTPREASSASRFFTSRILAGICCTLPAAADDDQPRVPGDAAQEASKIRRPPDRRPRRPHPAEPGADFFHPNAQVFRLVVDDMIRRVRADLAFIGAAGGGDDDGAQGVLPISTAVRPTPPAAPCTSRIFARLQLGLPGPAPWRL